jgi:hypothetical protein
MSALVDSRKPRHPNPSTYHSRRLLATTPTSRWLAVIFYLPRRIRKPSTRVYPKVSGLTAWSENCKWHSSLPLGLTSLLYLNNLQEGFKDRTMKFEREIICATSKTVWEPLYQKIWTDAYKCSELLLMACWPHGRINTTCPSIILMPFHKILNKHTQK